jgi:hypothetical protein
LWTVSLIDGYKATVSNGFALKKEALHVPSCLKPEIVRYSASQNARLEKFDNSCNCDMILIRVIELNSFRVGAVFRGRWAAQSF